MRLRELRINNNLTQNDVAEHLGVTGQTILNWENDIHEPKIAQLIQLADLFNVTVDYLIEHEPRKNNLADEICRELENISQEQFIKFIRAQLEESINNKEDK